MGKRKTNEQFIKEVYDLVGNEYTFLEEYIEAKIKIRCKHNTCGHEYFVTPSNFLRGRRCPKCQRPNYNRDTKQFKQEVYDLVGDEYTVLGEYKSIGEKIKIKHNSCGNIYEVVPNSFLRGCRCSKCMRPNYNRDTKQFKQEVFNQVGEEYSVLGGYVNTDTNIKMRHNKCGHEWYITPNSFLRGTRCPFCFGTIKKTTEEFKKEVYELEDDNYEVLGEYVNAHTKIKMRHNECGYEYYVKPTHFTDSNSRCPKCASSKGEKNIDKYLKENNINYISEYTFDNCRNKRPLPFDFYLPNHNLLIEYDGEQHYEPVCFGDISDDEILINFKRQQKHDKIKNTYCLKNNIPLIRIPYWDFDNIEEILEEALSRKDSAYFIA